MGRFAKMLQCVGLLFCFCIFTNISYSVDNVRHLAKQQVLVIIPESFNDIEFSSVIDVLRRASIDIVTVGLEGLRVMSAANTQLTTDRSLDKIHAKDFDALIILGSPFDTYYDRFPIIQALIQDFDSSDRVIGAVSLAPLSLSRAGILYRRLATVSPLFSGHLRNDTVYVANKAVIDGNIVTGYAPGNAVDFSLLVVEALQGKDMADAVRRELFL